MPMRRWCDWVRLGEAGSMRQHPSIQVRPAATEAANEISRQILRALCAQAGRAGKDSVEAILRAMEEAGEFRESRGELLRRRGAERHVAEFSAGTRRLAVKMEVRVANRQDFG